MFFRIMSTAALALMCLFTGVSILAATDPIGFNVGEAKVFPTVRLSVESNDNIFASTSQVVDSTGLRIQPKFEYLADKGQNSLMLAYSGDYLKSQEDSLNYADHRMVLRGAAFVSNKSRLTADASLLADHYDLGSTLSHGAGEQLSEPYQFRDFNVGIRYRYGANGARGNLIFGLNYRNRKFLNEPNSERPNRTNGLSSTRITPAFIASFRLSGNTRALLDLRYSIANYDSFTASSGLSDLDFESLRIGLGLQWNVSGRTDGRFIVGSRSTKFDSSDRGSDSVTEFELGAIYHITSYSELDIQIRREQATQTLGTNLSNSDVFEINWSHNWSSRVSSLLGSTWGQDSNVCGPVDVTNRKLKLTGEISTQVRRWLKIGARFQRNQESSGDCLDDLASDFKRNRGGSIR